MPEDAALDDGDRRGEAGVRTIGSRRPKRCSTGCWPRSTRRPTRSWSSTASGARSCATRPRGASAARATARSSPRTRVDGAAARGARPAQRRERELQLYGPPRQVLQLRAFPLRARRRGRRRGRVHPRHLRGAPRRERAPRLRRQREPRAEDADRRARRCSRRRWPRPTTSRVVQQLAERVVREADRLARIVDDLLDLSHDRGAGGADPRADARSPLLVAEAVERVQAAADAAGVPLQRRARAARRRDRRATAARCAARS